MFLWRKLPSSFRRRRDFRNNVVVFIKLQILSRQHCLRPGEPRIEGPAPMNSDELVEHSIPCSGSRTTLHTGRRHEGSGLLGKVRTDGTREAVP